MKPLVVLGDALLDVDIEGTVERFCPGTPAAVVDVGGELRRPGGAGLAALLASRSTAEVVLVTAIGDDDAGRTLIGLLDPVVEVLPLPLQGETVRKARVRVGNQSLLRLDTGDGMASTAPVAQRVQSVLRGAGAIVVADYGRGVAAHPDIRRLLAELAATVPIVWDPHPRGPAPTPGAWLISPNLEEARRFAPACGQDTELASVLCAEWAAGAVVVTTGADGGMLAHGGRTTTVSVPEDARLLASVEADACGAGDCFAAAVAAGLILGQDVAAAVAGAVETAARFIGAGGAGALSISVEPRLTAAASRKLDSAFEIAARIRATGGRLVATGGCFDLLHPGHVSLLRQSRALGDALVVCLNSDESVRLLKGEGRPIVPAQDRARLLTELSSVDAVAVFDEPSPAALLERLCPDVWVKGGDYANAELPESRVVHGYGGETVLIPTVAGYSTSRLVAAAHARS
ncbi:PfkB family carbohydrate kinase [Actinoalloteichus hymeniacidonis]|uniref:Cytidyltransferase-related enzyme n=1 Tax=Actinoalloteichus hymeniacidonis TaxID=340345 RepID=A0AAC9MYU1_9PSEU|nr:PfkB family carbohydrate kinase [Actinoalloteichus hymeniacidonis]AOS64708.1 cytidyltransferase-related enzyme [Actinoalloteichus hymeniacidonis]MBB5907216.1 rfaE bifunctional protein nucleotidyltransferase chain/domain [Actinoalloteichus hymeniacidonis]